MHQIPLYDQLVAEMTAVVFYQSANAVQWFSVVSVRFYWSLGCLKQLVTTNDGDWSAIMIADC
jgi:hypothetical protein